MLSYGTTPRSNSDHFATQVVNLLDNDSVNMYTCPLDRKAGVDVYLTRVDYDGPFSTIYTPTGVGRALAEATPPTVCSFTSRFCKRVRHRGRIDPASPMALLDVPDAVYSWTNGRRMAFRWKQDVGTFPRYLVFVRISLAPVIRLYPSLSEV